MFVDFHNHTKMCCHAAGEMEEYVLAAIARGISIFGFAGHSPWMIQDGPKMALAYDEVPIYLDLVAGLQQKYSSGPDARIQIRLGMEMDYVPDRIEYPRRYLKQIDFDYVIGSVHHIGTWGFDQDTQLDPFHKTPVRLIYERYFALLKEMIATGLFNIVGHIDLVKKFGHFPETGWDDIQEDVAAALGQSDMVVELNTSGLDKPVHEFYPGITFLKRLRKHNVPVTLGSDSHHPREVGRHFKEAAALLHEVGYTEIMTFEKRKLKAVPIP